jgi:hypothetical protein
MLRASDTDTQRQADALAHALPKPRGDLGRPAGDPLEPAHVEERLVDGHGLHHRRRVPEDVEDRLARLDVRGEVRLDDHRIRAESPGPPATHRRADAARPRLVAGRHDHAAADDHGPAAERRIVALLDRREERIEVCVQDRGLARHERMFA